VVGESGKIMHMKFSACCLNGSASLSLLIKACYIKETSMSNIAKRQITGIIIPFPMVLWFWFPFGDGFWLVQGVCLGCPPIFIGSLLSLSFGSRAVRTLPCNPYPYLLKKKKYTIDKGIQVYLLQIC
jgi:hypothetical protein